jgi:4-amino-4-deoxy-L-arabinose transferase-like glycosyltransferase
MRVLTALMAAAIPLLTWLICRRLDTTETAATAAAALTLAVPGLTRVTGMVSNDSFMVLTAAGLSLALVHVATGDLSRRTALMTGGLTAAALLTKGFGLPLPLLVVGSYLIAARGGLRRVLIPLATALGVGFVFGGIWWLRNLIAFGAIQPNGYGTPALSTIFNRPNVHGGGPLGPYVRGIFDRLSRSFWGGVGTTSSPTISKELAVWVSIAALVVVALGIIVGVRGRHRLVLLLLAAPVLLALVIVVQGSLPIYNERGQIRGVQGRYLYLAIPGLAVCAAVAADRVLLRARGLLPALAVLVLIAMQSVGAVRVVKRLWWAPERDDNTLSSALHHLEVLSPWPDWVTQGCLYLTAAVAVAALSLAAYEGVRALTSSGREATSLPA